MELESLEDGILIARLKDLVRQEREDTAGVVAHLAEVDRRGLAVVLGYPSLFEYCVRELGYSEASAYHRIRAARAIRRKPELLDLLRKGEIHLRAVVLLHPHLDAREADSLVRQAQGKTQRELETLLAPLSPRPQARDTIRVVAVEKAGGMDLPLFPSPEAAPAIETRVFISFMANTELLEMLERAKGLLRHKHPEGRLEGIFRDSLAALIERKDPENWLPSSRRTPGASRAIPRQVRKAVWRRDRGRCVYNPASGRTCGSRHGLQFDHILPWALGGSSNDPNNIRLLCRAHNLLAARLAGLGPPSSPR